MIAYIKGIIGELTPTEVVIEAAGVGYGLTISLNTFANLQGKESAKVYVKEVIAKMHTISMVFRRSKSAPSSRR